MLGCVCFSTMKSISILYSGNMKPSTRRVWICLHRIVSDEAWASFAFVGNEVRNLILGLFVWGKLPVMDRVFMWIRMIAGQNPEFNLTNVEIPSIDVTNIDILNFETTNAENTNVEKPNAEPLKSISRIIDLVGSLLPFFFLEKSGNSSILEKAKID